MDGKAKRRRAVSSSAPSLEERNHSDQGAQRDDQNAAEGRDGADVAQIRVAAAHAAVLRCIATFVVKIARFVVRAVTTDYSLDVDFELNFDALIEPDAASLFLPFAETTVVTIVAFERQN